MSLFQTCFSPNPFFPLSAVNSNPKFDSFLSIDGVHPHHSRISKSFTCFSVSREPNSDPGVSSDSKSKPKFKKARRRIEDSSEKDENPEKTFPTTNPSKLRRWPRSEAVAVEDYIRDKLEQTLESMRQKDPERFLAKGKVLRERIEDLVDSESTDKDEDEGDDDDDDDGKKGKEKMVEEDDPDWPVDADVGWGVRASEYFEKYPIKNVVGEDGAEIDWEGEMDECWVQEINCLEWESFAFHPSPLIVLVFERYESASLNWKTLKELENAIKVYWNAKDRLPPRAVKLDMNIERDMAYALKVKKCPQILFLRGNKIVYKESEFRTAEELVQMIAHFYYNAKRPSWVIEEAK